MNGNQFDRLSRSLVVSFSRRGLVRAWMGAGLGALAGRSFSAPSTAAKRRKKRKKRK
jgi:hypothetical protein